MVSAGVKYFPGRCVLNGGEHIIGLMCGAMKLYEQRCAYFVLE